MVKRKPRYSKEEIARRTHAGSEAPHFRGDD